MGRSRGVRGKIWSAILLVLGCVLTAGCDFTGLSENVNNPAEPPAAKTTIVFWNENAAADRTAYYQTLIAQFERENPDIHVEYVGLPKKAARLKINTAIATNDLPDVCGMQSAWLAEFCNQDVLLDLDPWFQQWDGREDLLPEVIEGNRRMTEDRFT